MKYVFFGTPRFAEIVLRGLIDANMAPAALVCNPDRPVGRKRALTPPLTKQLIEESRLDIPVYQPETKIELEKTADEVFEGMDFGVLAAYGTIVSKKVIESSGAGIVGVHPSLLPKYRGASPIQGVLLQGEQKSGTTLFLLDEEVDHGDILVQEELPIGEINYLDLERSLAELSSDLLIKTLPKFYRGEIEPKEQNHDEATFTGMFKTEDAYINPDDLKIALGGNLDKARDVERIVRAFNPEPGPYTELEGKRTKILDVRIEGRKLVLKKIHKEGGKPQTL